MTGGSSGIGAAIARALAAKGRRLVLVARSEERLRAVAEELGAEWETCDVGDRAAVERLAASVRERHPSIGLLVNNAGIPGRGGFLRATPERAPSRSAPRGHTPPRSTRSSRSPAPRGSS